MKKWIDDVEKQIEEMKLQIANEKTENTIKPEEESEE